MAFLGKLRTQKELHLIVLFLLSMLVYLFIANNYWAPQGYYGTVDAPRFADPWIARTETIINGGLLYRDVFTTTPPLTNLLLIPPSLIPIYFGNINPWATLSYMVWFSLFNLLTAFVLLRMGHTRSEGYRAAVIFLLNPLTFGNTILRRQDESIVVFFVAFALMFVLQRRHVKAGIAIGFGLLVKLSAGIILPAAFLAYRKFSYFVYAGLTFILGLAPFLLLAGRDAIFWNVGTSGGQHPFQYRGVSVPGLWNQFQPESLQIPLWATSTALVLSTLVMLGYLWWKRPGILASIMILLVSGFIFSPKLHTGYFSILVLAMTPLIKKPQTVILFWLFGLAAMIADFYKWPIINIEAAFWWMLVTFGLMIWLTVTLSRADSATLPSTTANAQAVQTQQMADGVSD